ncbi:MAG: hypothetical protein KBT03_10500 [Bacteroidales bacterium]|nr:hypothetical protein [Candidatus Scybalousia scybalohippi]
MNVKRYDGESRIKYIVRVCENKTVETWDEIGEFLRKELNENYSSSAYRKMYQYWLMVKDDLKDVSIEEQLQELEEMKEELYKERVKIQDANREKRSVLREEARYENLIEVLKDSLYDEKEIKFTPFVKEENNNKKYGVLQLSDWHCGAKIDNQFNYYDIDVMIERADIIKNKMLKYAELHKVTDLIIEINGDMIDGLIHISSRVQQEECAVEQYVTVTDVLIAMIKSIQPYFNSVKIVTTLGNHGRMVAKKSDCSTKENFEMMIPTRLRDKLQGITVIDSHGLDFVKYEIEDKVIMVSHGQNDKINNCVSDFVKMFKVVPDEIHLGHTHSYKDINDCDIMITVNGCLDGSDDYALSIRKVSKPSQNFIVYEDDRCIYKLNAE